MLRGLRSLDRYTREIFTTGSESYKSPYSSLGQNNTLPHPPSAGGGGGGGPSSTTTYDWIYRGSGANTTTTSNTMPPLVRNPSTTYLMGTCDAQDVATKLKCVLVGDGSVGKTSLIVSYTTNGYPTEYVPTAFDNYNVVVNVDNQPIRLQLCDTAGQDDFDSLRPLCYPGTDVFLVCFSVVSPTSFHNVKEKWLQELKHHNPRAPIVLVGTQSDLRTDVKVLIELAQYREQPVSEVAARRLAHQIGAVRYVESSALTQRNLKEVFDQAILAALEARNAPASFSRSGSAKRSFTRYRKPCPPVTTHHSGGDSPTEPLHHPTHGPVIDYDCDNSRKPRGWKKLCCFS